MSRLFLLLVLAMAAFVAADTVVAADDSELFEADDNQLFDPNDKLVITHMEEVTDDKKLQLLKSSHVCPPYPHIAVACPPSNLFFYYKCCGEKNKACCKQHQGWILVFFLLLVVLIVLSACLRACK